MKILRFNESNNISKCICKKEVSFTNGIRYYRNEFYEYIDINNTHVRVITDDGSTVMTSVIFDEHFILEEDFLKLIEEFSILGDLSFADIKYVINSTGSVYVHIEKKVGGNNFLTIYPKNGKDGRFGINVTGGTIKNPSNKPGSTWYGLTNKNGNDSLSIDDVYDSLISYGIASKSDKELALSAFKYNI